jgi:4-amino-4-deoxy-L-arabinose transferase-like glycosyltransferase
LTSPCDRKYITSVVKRGDSWAGVAIYRAAKKAISYQGIGATAQGRAVMFALAAGALVRILAVTAVFGWSTVPTRSDDATYRHIAEWFMASGHMGTHHFPVGYPLFLGVILGTTGGSYVAVRFAQVLLGVLTIFVSSRIARLLCGERAAVIAAWLVALYPPLLYLTGRIMSETLFISLLMSSLLFFLKGDREDRGSFAVLAGALFALACIVRSNLVPMVPVVPAWLLARPGGTFSEKLRVAVLSGATLGAVMMTPGLYFLATQGEFIPFATNAGQTFYGANNPLADGGWIQVEDHPELLQDIPPSVRASATAYSRAQYRLGLRWIQENPEDFVRLLPKKLANAWLPGFQRSELISGSRSAFALQALSLGFILLAGMAGRVFLRPRQRDGLLLAVLGTYTFMSLVFYGNPRIGAFCTPILIIYASALLASLNLGRACSESPGTP